VDSPHPPGFEEPERHGPASLLQDPTEGDCRDCHGDDLAGGSASGCDDCHADAGHGDWQTDCVFCHGGDLEGSGAPPRDIDGETEPDAISFGAHTAHVLPGGEYAEVGCVACHLEYTGSLEAEHWFDGSPAVSEVVPSGAVDPGFAWEAGSCSESYCHSDGHRADGQATDDGQAMTCDSCHATADASAMSGLHGVHLGFSDPASCDDCHASTMDGDTVVVPELHVDGTIDVVMGPSGISWSGPTCEGSCHGYDHGAGWGHPRGYDDPEAHGWDANMQVSACGSCHGEDWSGGLAQGCDDCHAAAGHGDWRTDCTFCHGGENGDVDGLPPEDVDNESDETQISF
jgi:hypothetical protein